MFDSRQFHIFGLLHRVQIMHSNVMSLRFMNVVFTRIDFAIQKGLAAQLVACLPSFPFFLVK